MLVIRELKVRTRCRITGATLLLADTCGAAVAHYTHAAVAHYTHNATHVSSLSV